ncbi:MAG: general secretion pathway protein GspK [Candidatus Omnitrophica bacterium]|nr:general secretion pathway protein GspK [Candidatus Omnitrophota bacterium]
MIKNLTRQKASVLIITLFVVFFLSGIALSISQAMRINAKIISRHVQNQKSLNIAESAVLLALAELKTDKKDNNYDAFQDGWYGKFQERAKIKSFKFKNNENSDIGKYSISISDESARMNINTISVEIIGNLINQLSKTDNSKLIQAVADYRIDLGQKQIVKSVYQLLKIKLIDKSVFWGEDTNDNNQLDPWEDDQADSQPDDNGNNFLDLGVKDFFTVFTDGKINLNTVSEKVLLSLPGMTEEGAQAIINFRKNQPFANEKDLENITSIGKQTSQFIMRWGSVRSDIFRIIVTAQAIDAKNYKQIIAVVDRSQLPIKILYWREN